MPKKLKELSKLTIGLRHRLIFEAVENYGLVTIADVLNHVSTKADIDIRKSNVMATLKKSVENDLRSFIGGKGKLSVRYYQRDGLTEVPTENIEENKDGSVKNKYCIKYYLIGGGIQIPGVSLLSGYGIQLESPNFRIVKLQVDPAHRVEDLSKYTLVFEKNGYQFSAINFNKEDFPIGFLVGRTSSELPPSKKLIDKFGTRTCLLKFEHVSIDRYSIDSAKSGHAYIKITENGEIEITDHDSLNGTSYCEVSKEMRKLIFSDLAIDENKKTSKSPKAASFDKLKFQDYYPFHNKTAWNPINSKILLRGDGYLVRTGEITFFVGRPI